MDFDLTEEQRLLQASVGKLIADHYDFEQRKACAREPAGYSGERWAQFAEMGLLGLPFVEHLGGSEGTPIETMIVMEAFGRGLVLEPYLATVILGGGLLRVAGSPAQQQELIPAIAAGKLRLAFGYAERQSRYDLADIATSAKEARGGYVLEGEKGVVLHGDSADRLIVLARTAGGPRDASGLSLFMVDPNADGVQRRGYPTQDGQRAAEIVFREVKLGPEALLGAKDQAWPAVERVVDSAIAAVAAECVGVLSAMHELTVEYLKTRKQFGVPIGSFQALQHRAVDMLVSLEQARSMAYLATMMADSEDAAERRRMISAVTRTRGRRQQTLQAMVTRAH